MLKKVIVCLCFAAMLTLSACGQTQQTPPPPPQVATPPEYGTETPPGEADIPDYSEEVGYSPIHTPEAYLAANDAADIIVGEEGAFYAEATKVPWIGQQLDLTDTVHAASIKRSGVTEGFQAWDATRLPLGAEVLRHNQEPDILVVEVEGELIPYLRFQG